MHLSQYSLSDDQPLNRNKFMANVRSVEVNAENLVTSAISPLQNVLCCLKYDNTLVSLDCKWWLLEHHT